jgi:hypothetical protein
MIYGIVGIFDDVRYSVIQRPSSAGNGKTNLMAHILYEEFLRKDRNVIANFHLKYKGSSFASASWATYMTSQEIFDHWFDEELEGSIIGITELQSLLNSAGRSAKMITYLERCLNQRRKSDYDLIWDSQRWGSVDKRVRDNTDEVYHPMKYHCIYDPEEDTWRPTYPCLKDRCDERHLIAVHCDLPLPPTFEEQITPLYFMKSWEIGELYNTKEKMLDTLNYNPAWERQNGGGNYTRPVKA